MLSVVYIFCWPYLGVVVLFFLGGGGALFVCFFFFLGGGGGLGGGLLFLFCLFVCIVRFGLALDVSAF